MEKLSNQMLLEALRGGDVAARLKAIQQAQTLDAKAIPMLLEMVGGREPGAAKAAGEALRVLANHASRAGAEAERKAVAQALAQSLQPAQNTQTCTVALKMLGIVGGSENVPAIAALLTSEEVGDFARMALERIPGSASEKALQKALVEAPKLRPSLEQALKHRRTRWRELGTRR